MFYKSDWSEGKKRIKLRWGRKIGEGNRYFLYSGSDMEMEEGNEF